MQIDCYGFEASSQWFRRKELEVYLMKEVEGSLYLLWESAHVAYRAPLRAAVSRRNTAAFSSAHSRIDHDEHGCTRESWALLYSLAFPCVGRLADLSPNAFRDLGVQEYGIIFAMKQKVAYLREQSMHTHVISFCKI